MQCYLHTKEKCQHILLRASVLQIWHTMSNHLPILVYPYFQLVPILWVELWKQCSTSNIKPISKYAITLVISSNFWDFISSFISETLKNCHKLFNLTLMMPSNFFPKNDDKKPSSKMMTTKICRGRTKTLVSTRNKSQFQLLWA